MNVSRREIWFNTYRVCGYFAGHLKKDPSSVNSPGHCAGSHCFQKIGAVLKRALVKLAMAVSAAAASAFDALCFPFRILILKRRFQRGVKADLATLSESRRADLSQRVSAHLDAVGVNKNKKLLQTIMGCYARTFTVCGPMIASWADHLLYKASLSKKKIVFMARDGVAPYLAAQNLLARFPSRYPGLSQKDLSLGYFSRKVVKNCSAQGESGKTLIKSYFKQLGIQPGDNCLLVDSGYQGSMIPKLKQLLNSNELSFEYLISLTNEAEGFAGSFQNPLKSVKRAAGNLGVMWLESSLQGVVKSPNSLIYAEGGVFPDTCTPGEKKTYTPTSLNALSRKWALAGIMDAVEQCQPDSLQAGAIKQTFDQTLGKVAACKIPSYWVDE